MSAGTLSPPRPPVCLTRSYLSRGIKGGTVIAEDVVDRDEHGERMTHPDGYRSVVAPCGRCGCARVHALCFRERRLRGGSPGAGVEIVSVRLFRCASKACDAVFTVLPAFIARHLWRSWKTVEEACKRKTAAPRTTLRRWLGRYRSDASQLVQLFTSSTEGPVPEILKHARPLTRRAFLDALAPVLRVPRSMFASVAGWIHRLSAGIRLM